MSSLKYEVDSRKKTARDLEEKLGKLERRHWDAMSKGEDSRKDLEQKNKDKTRTEDPSLDTVLASSTGDKPKAKDPVSYTHLTLPTKRIV